MNHRVRTGLGVAAIAGCLVGALVISISSSKKPLPDRLPGSSDNSCFFELQRTAKCVTGDNKVVFNNARGRRFELKDGEPICFGSGKLKVSPVGGDVFDVSFVENATGNAASTTIKGCK